MAIIEKVDLEARFGPDEIARLSDRDADGFEDAGVIDAAIADAEAETVARLGPALSGPLPSPAPEMLKQIVAVIARYNLARRDVEPEHPYYVAYQDAVATLRDAAAGKVELADLSGAPVSAPSLMAFGPSRSFTDDALAPMLPRWPR
ncbi:phage protein Gp36 family protein [Oceanicella actignis]|uniref:phage protein Gp36 family protein n=1 Tax=Oceanicella actignis TaxID=1189325 RepID=UPI0011E6F258|nr:phage protein Gp36 family protein [Oceanicella actignis]TYO91432.1 phage gp36-like protein [Oceanicella actignis]